MPCIHGHPFLDGSDVCAQGHAGPEENADPGQHQFAPTTPAAPAASITDLQNLLHQMLNIQNTSLQRPPAPVRNQGKAKPERPTIKQNSSDGDWLLYEDSWRRYKAMCKLTDPTEVRNELRCTCSHDVNQLLFDIVGPRTLDACTETELLAHIKSVAVQGSHKEVHRQRFQALKQDEGQLVTSYLAKLKSQAKLCDFNVTCTNPMCLRSVSYSTNMVAGQLIAGLYNADHQAKVLAEAASLTTLQAKFDRLVSLETTDTATKRLNMTVANGPSSSNVLTSGTRRQNQVFQPRRRPFQQQQRQYQRQQQQQYRPPPPQNPSVYACKGCGETSHPPGKSMRRADCPAFNQTCNNCGIKGHLLKVCRKQRSGNNNNNSSSTTRSLDATQDDVPLALVSGENHVSNPQEEVSDLSSVSYIFVGIAHEDRPSGSSDSMAVPHMEWDGEKFVKQAPKEPPRLTITIEVITDRSVIPTDLPFPPSFRTRTATASILADSGAQTCSGDIPLLTQLGCTVENLLPTSHGIRGVTNTRLELLGILPVRITAGDHRTNQIMYFAKNTRGCLLSEKALIDLRILPSNFPAACRTTTTSISSFVRRLSAPCGCLKRLPPPPLPEAIPFPPVPGNVAKLESFIRSFFAASAFNVCPHQPLPAMTGDLMTVTLRQDAMPYAIHTPIPIPLHW